MLREKKQRLLVLKVTGKHRGFLWTEVIAVVDAVWLM
jgi:hypothetical protein